MSRYHPDPKVREQIDDPEAQEQMEILARDKGYARIREKLQAELAQRIKDLIRAEPEAFRGLQGRIAALEFALGLPQQIYVAAGGKRKLFEEPV